ncbi:uncharacterized protein A4U43_UnF6530 [Asparagus officinalis]|uniref:Uncharacterized protein n=1 Tax=Asparagus officinalis TaxID=4686 RepID=A0A1R3L6G2_ASPOF|nr:uncharacterized protein A4U43_UnF6530 [Asparagus officinalis]
MMRAPPARPPAKSSISGLPTTPRCHRERERRLQGYGQASESVKPQLPWRVLSRSTMASGVVGKPEIELLAGAGVQGARIICRGHRPQRPGAWTGIQLTPKLDIADSAVVMST